MPMETFFQWFTGGSDYSYHTLSHCLDGDYLTIALAILLCCGVFVGYLVIAWRWSQAAKAAPDSNIKSALTELKWIFIFCGLCGYSWVVLEAVWPAWRLYIFFLFALNVYTWKYVFRIKHIEELYSYLKEKDNLVGQVRRQKEEIAMLKKEAEDNKAV